MLSMEPSYVEWTVVLLMVTGLVVTALARAGEGSASQSVWQALFLVLFCTLAVATVALLGFSPGTGMACGATLSTMAVAVIWDPHPKHGQPASR